MKKIGRVLMVFALVAMMLSTSLMLTPAKAQEDEQNVDYYYSWRDEWNYTFEDFFNETHGGSDEDENVGEAELKKWRDSFFENVYNGNEFGWQRLTSEYYNHPNQNSDPDPDVYPNHGTRTWKDYGYTLMTYHYNDGCYEASFKIKICVAKMYINNVETDQLKITDVVDVLGNIYKIAYGKINGNVYKIRMAWYQLGTNGNLGWVYGTLSVDLDQLLSDESQEYDWIFKGFEWNTENGIKAYAVYKCLGIGINAQVKLDATVTKVSSYAIASKYKAVITADEAPDGIEHSETKTIWPSIPKPTAVPRVRDDLIGPPQEMKPGEGIIKPPVELTPVLP